MILYASQLPHKRMPLAKDTAFTGNGIANVPSNGPANQGMQKVTTAVGPTGDRVPNSVKGSTSLLSRATSKVGPTGDNAKK